MSAARVGRWDLLDHDDDPVAAEASGLDAVIKHYTEIAEMMTTQAALLKKIGDGDETLLKGQSADAMRKRAGESHDHLGKAAARYDDVKVALVEYQPALETARSETGKALVEAETAAERQAGAEAMADPVNADRPDDAKPLTESEKQDSQNRTSKIDGAKADLDGAKAKCQAALDTLQAAADRAAAKIKENWGDDGLGHSWQEAFAHFFNKLLKKLVEILGYIGMVLAVLAMIIPGLGVLAWVALGVAVAGFLGSLALAAQGEGSWLSVILCFVGVVACGVGVGVAKAITGAVAKAAAQGAGAIRQGGIELSHLAQLRSVMQSNLRGPFGGVAGNVLQSTGPRLTNGLRDLEGLTAAVNGAKSGSWFTSGFRGIVGLEGIKGIGAINTGLKTWGWTTVGVKPWVYIGGPTAVISGFVSGGFGTIVPPTNFDGPDARGNWTDRADFEYAYLTSPAKLPLEPK